MSKAYCCLVLLLFISFQLNAQVLPKEGAQLNYRLIGFSFDVKEKTKDCKLEIAKGDISTDEAFKKNIVKTYSCKESRIIAEVPAWGEHYTWRVSYINEQAQKVKSELHHFVTLMIPEVDTNNMRLRILESAKKFKDAYVMLDGNKIMYDMSGHPVWFLPCNDFNSAVTNDLKVSGDGTITFLNTQAYEISYDGDTLFTAPNTGEVSGEKQENYHHEFTKLQNGHYMILGTQSAMWHLKTENKFADTVNAESGSKSPFATIIEYDKNGKLFWSWKSLSYFSIYGLPYYNPETNPSKGIMDPHANSFYFDEDNGFIYISFKNSNQVLKVKYPEGNVLNVYGEKYENGEKKVSDLIFCGQHGVKKSKKGYVYLFDNNSCADNLSSKVLKMEETGSVVNNLRIVWEYTCTVENGLPRKARKGGNVIELPDNCIFVSMGDSYSKLFIVDSNKQIYWSSVSEKWDSSDRKWNVMAEYRTSIIADKEKLERLIWRRR